MSKNTRNRVIEAAIKLLAQDPRASLDTIADAAQVGRATVYRLFHKKSDLLTELVMQANREGKEVVARIDFENSDTKDILYLLIAGMLPLAPRFRFLSFEPFAHSTESMMVYQYWLNFWRTFAERMKKEGIVAQDVPTAWIAHSFDTLIFSLWSCIEAGEVAVKEAPNLALRTFLYGLAPHSELRDKHKELAFS